MSENTKYYCGRCNKEINNSFVYISEIDYKYLCNDCLKKEQPKELAKQIDQLKQQLAEKDKEIERLKGFIGCKGCVDVIKKSNEDQNQLAIRELEKVKDFICDCTYIKEPDYTNVRCKIDQQIKELKGEKDVED